MNKLPLCLCALLLVFAFSACNNAEHGDHTHDTKGADAPAPAKSYTLDGAQSDVQFVIVSNSAGPITGHFPDGLSGSLDGQGKGSFEIQLGTLKSLDQNNAENPIRDANVVEAFFGVRPSSVMLEAVDQAWALLDGKLERSVATARFEAVVLEGMDAPTGNLKGNLVLWNKVSIPLTFPVSITKTEGGLELVSSAPADFDLEKVLGSDLRKLAFDTMLAAGCAHQPGIQNKVEISLNKVVLKN